MAKPIVAFGDSNMLGHGLPGYVPETPTAQAFISIVATALGVGKTMRASTGHQCADQSFNKLYGTVSDPENWYVSMLCTNDSQQYGTSVLKRTASMRFYRNILAWNLCADKKFPRVAGVTTSGVWTDTPVNSIGKTTSEAGAYAEASMEGDAAYVSFFIHNDLAVAFDVYVDGVLKQSVAYAAGDVGATLVGLTYAPAAIRIAGLGGGAHTVRVVLTSGTIFLDFIAGSGQHTARPVLFVADVLQRGAYTGDNSSANVIAYNAAIAELVAEMVTDGHRVYPIHHEGYFDPAIHYDADKVHPNVAGHIAISQAYLAVMQVVNLLPLFEAEAGAGALLRRTFIGNPII